MKHFKFSTIVLALIVIIGCEKDSDLKEPEFVEQYYLSGYLNGDYMEFTKSGEGECISNNVVNDSIEICREVSFYGYNSTDDLVTITISRHWYVPQEKILLEEEPTDTLYKYTPSFIQFDDFANEFRVGSYDYSFIKDETFTTVTIGRENSTSYFSYEQPSSDFSFIVDTLMVSEEQEMIYVAGNWNSVNSSEEPEHTNKMTLENMRFGYCLKNESLWYKNE